MIQEILSWFFGGTTLMSLLGWFYYRKQNTALKDAEVLGAKAENERTAFLALEHAYNTTAQMLSEQVERVKEYQRSIDTQVTRTREISDRLYTAERDLNVANKTITTLTEERDDERRKKEYYKRWRCEKSICGDPEGRRPPNSKLEVEIFNNPE